ncbi:MAG: DUF1848 domain-containing protein [Bacteroidota bacterium]
MNDDRYVISASRRTDIPAFFIRWFLEQLRAGWVDVPDPFSGKLQRISLQRDDVRAIVFWSRDYAPLLPHLDEIDDRGYPVLFHFTITGLPKVLEPHGISVARAVYLAERLSIRYSPEHVLWRFDPIIISNNTPASSVIKKFDELAQMLKGVVRRVYVSFIDFYSKVNRNLSALQSQAGIQVVDPPVSEKRRIGEELSSIATRYGMEVYSCTEPALIGAGGIKKGSCIDAQLLESLYPGAGLGVPKHPTRAGCGCFESKDIGIYNTCFFGCRYCYATSSLEQVKKRASFYRIKERVATSVGNEKSIQRVEQPSPLLATQP